MADSITTIGLCAGVGWLDEAVAAGLRYFGREHRVAAYCEWEAYAASVLLARMEDESLGAAPVWCGDLADFCGRRFRGTVDGIVAGFPCQPWSNAGRRLGTDDDRWLWPAIVRIIADVAPGFVFLENVAALIAGGGLEYVLSDLAKMGFDAEWCCLTAEAVGASHRRERVFILAYRPWFREMQRTAGRRGEVAGETHVDGSGGGLLADPNNSGTARFGRDGGNRDAESGESGAEVASVGNSHEPGLQGRGFSGRECSDEWIAGEACHPLFASGPGADWSSIPEYLWPATERGFRVLVDGCPVVLDESRADQLRCSGNGVVALCGAVAFVELVRRAVI